MMAHDEGCTVHEHFGRPCMGHHFVIHGTEYRCPFCGRVTQSVTSENAARRLRDRVHN